MQKRDTVSSVWTVFSLAKFQWHRVCIFFCSWADGRDSRDRVELVPVDAYLSHNVATYGNSSPDSTWIRNCFQLLSQTGGALLCFVDTNPASKAFVVCFVGWQDRKVPARPWLCVCLNRNMKALLGALQSPDRACKSFCVWGKPKTLRGTQALLEAFQRPDRACKPSCVQGKSKTPWNT